MKNERLTYIKNILFPCLFFSAITGVVTGGLIFAFKVATSAVLSLSARAYDAASAAAGGPWLLLGGAALLGLLASLLLKIAPDCRGGGIPTSVIWLRGVVNLNWLKSILCLFPSALLSYLGGVPLGNEGPSVQMGAAVGKGTVRLLARGRGAWDRYVMTGGACAGFAAATGAPLSGIFFALEEAHRRFSPMIFMVASMTVACGSATMAALCRLFDVDSAMFSLSVTDSLPLHLIWAALIVGAVCGACALLFTKAYRALRHLISDILARVPFTVQVVAVFVLSALAGLVSRSFIWTGHDLIEQLFEGHGLWYALLLILLVRAVLLMLGNIVGVTGGLFVPTLTFGAIVGLLCARALIALGLFPAEYGILLVMVGIASYLAASSRTPLTAIAFAIEALCGPLNILPVIVGVTIAYLVIETAGIPAFTESVMERRAEAAHRGKEWRIVDTYFTVMPGAFAIGKEIRDILWPPSCVVLSVDKAAVHSGTALGAGDMLHIHYGTYDPPETTQALSAILGKQLREKTPDGRPGDEHHQVPEL